MSVLVVSWDRVGSLMAGSAVRALEMARALARRGLPVVLAAPDGSHADPEPNFALVQTPSGGRLADLIDAASVVVLPGRIELMTAVRKPLVVDLYDPFILSNLDLFGQDFAHSKGRSLLALRWLQHHLAHGDFFLCASPAQRSFWLGMLAAAGRINRANYERDPELRGLIDIAPFGLPDAPPETGPTAIRGVIPGIDEGDRVVLWAGGMWNWVDPLTLIRATALLRERRREVKTLVLGTRHPNPEIGEMEVAREAIALARELGLYERGVSFVDWVPYDERHLYILESDVGVSLHRHGVESEFAFRTRVLDYLWGCLPMVLTSGDDLAARVAQENLGQVVGPDDPAEVARAIEAVLDDPDPAARARRLATARDSFAWSRVIEPLARFCEAPHHAADRDRQAWFAGGTAREGLPRKEDALVAEEFVSAARALSPGIGPDYSPTERFRAAYDGLCQVEVLLWVEPPVGGSNLVFELVYPGDEPVPLATVVVPAASLPRSDWQRFEFSPIEGSAGRELEFRLSLVAAPSAAEEAPSWGRVSVWRCAPPPDAEVAGESLVFIARYLVAGVAPEVPVAAESFLFLHNTSVRLAGPVDPAMPVLAVEEGERAPGAGPAGDVERLRAELARVALQASFAERRARELEARLEERVAERAAAVVRAELRNLPLGVFLIERALQSAIGLARLAKRTVGSLLILALAVLCIPLAALVGLSIAACDLAAALVRRAPAARRRPAARGASDLRSAGTGAIGADAAVSVVIPTWNGRELLEMSLPPLREALRRHGNPADEIIVVDNGSDDDSIDLLQRLSAEAPELHVVRLATNEGFAGAANRGGRAARNPLLILLNNDMVVEPDFIQPLVDAFVEQPGAFGVSCQIDFIDPKKERWETGKVHARLVRGRVRLFHLDRFDDDLLYPVFFAGGGASAYDREKFLELGGFDEAVFSPVYIEDVDLGYRAWKRGWPSLLAPRSRVHHKHRSTTRRLWSEGRIHSFFVKNLAALVWKNVASWRILVRHLAGLAALPIEVRREQNGRSALATVVGLARQLPATLRARWREAAADRRLSDEEIFQLSRYRHAFRARYCDDRRAPGEPLQVLLISPYSPVPAVHGGATRMRNLLREMRGECEVTLVSYYDTEVEAAPQSLAELRSLCRDATLIPRNFHERGGRLMPNATVGFWSQRMFDEVEYRLDRGRFDVVQVEYTHMAHYLPAPTPGMRRVLVEHDIAFVALARERVFEPSRLRRLSLWVDSLRTLRYEVAAVEGADVVVAMSAHDRDQLARFVDPSHVAVVPNGVSCRDFPERDGEPEPATILFVGFFRHPPNIEAVEWFGREVLPIVRERVPEAIFRVVGAYPPASLEELARATEGMELTGMVAETGSHYRRATVFVAPILRGSGTRLKILEAMASGCPVVSTTVGAEGLGAGPDHIRIADQPSVFAEAVCTMIRNRSVRDALTRRARAFVEREYDWPMIARRLLAAYGVDPAAQAELDDEPPLARAGGRR